MMSLAKLLVLALVVMACVTFAKRLGGKRASDDDQSEAQAYKKVKSETLEKCPTCGVFRPQGMKQPCERPDCPHHS